MINKYMKKIFFVFLALFFPLMYISGHGTGQSLEVETGAYLVDIGYSAFGLYAGEANSFDINLLHKETKEQISFTNVWVRIAEEELVVFASNIARARLGKTAMTFIFPDAGAYTISVRFEDEDGVIVEAGLPLVIESARSNTKQTNLWWVFVFVAGGGVGYILFRLRAYLKNNEEL